MRTQKSKVPTGSNSSFSMILTVMAKLTRTEGRICAKSVRFFVNIEDKAMKSLHMFGVHTQTP